MLYTMNLALQNTIVHWYWHVCTWITPLRHWSLIHPGLIIVTGITIQRTEKLASSRYVHVPRRRAARPRRPWAMTKIKVNRYQAIVQSSLSSAMLKHYCTSTFRRRRPWPGRCCVPERRHRRARISSRGRTEETAGVAAASNGCSAEHPTDWKRWRQVIGCACAASATVDDLCWFSPPLLPHSISWILY
jgi:hypothetical protein